MWVRSLDWHNALKGDTNSNNLDCDVAWTEESRGQSQTWLTQLSTRTHYLTYLTQDDHLFKPACEGGIVYVLVLSCIQLFVTPWTVAHQAPPSMEFSRQEYWSGQPFPSPEGIFQIQGSNLGLPCCRHMLYRLGHQGNTYSLNFTDLVIQWTFIEHLLYARYCFRHWIFTFEYDKHSSSSHELYILMGRHNKQIQVFKADQLRRKWGSI